MQLPKLRSAALWITVSLDVILAVAIALILLNQGKRTENRPPQPKPAAKVTPPKVEPEVAPGVTRQRHTIWVRVVDAAGSKPISLARIVIANGNLAPELGDDSDAVTWPDGRAIIDHKFFVWEEHRGDEKSPFPMIFQGPWIHVSAEGYEPAKTPLLEVLRPEGAVGDFAHEAIVTLRRKQAPDPTLADLEADYIYGTGFFYQHLEIGRQGQYHFQWYGDKFTDNPHDQDRHESRGRCSIVNGVVRLVPEGPFSSELRKEMGNDFVPIRWGSRRYLIPEKERLTFCSAVNQGDFPRYMRSGPFALGTLDFRKRPEGLPEVLPDRPPSFSRSPWWARSPKFSPTT